MHKGFPQWLGGRLDRSASTVPINSETPQLLPPFQGGAEAALLAAVHFWSVLVVRSKPRERDSREKQGNCRGKGESQGKEGEQGQVIPLLREQLEEKVRSLGPVRG